MSDEHDWRRRRSVHRGDASRATGRWRAEHDAEPFDMAAVHTDDQFLEALSKDVPVPTHDDAEYQLAELLSGWRHESLAAPIPELPTVDEVERAIAASEKVGTGRRVARHLRLASGAAAVVVIAGAGLTVLAEGSEPGDPLWGMKKVVFAEAASQTQAATDVQSNLERAEAAMAAGDTEQAATLIAKAQQNLGPVRDAEIRNRMNDWITRLRAGADTSAPSSTSASLSRDTTTSAERPGPSTPPRDLRKQTATTDPSTSVTVPSTPPETRPDDPTSVPGTGGPSTPPPEFPTQSPTPTPTYTTTVPSRPADLSEFPLPGGDPTLTTPGFR